MRRGPARKIFNEPKKRTRKEIQLNKDIKTIVSGMRALWFRIEGENYRSYPDANLIAGSRNSFWELKCENNPVKPLQKKRIKWLVMERGIRVFLLRKHSKYYKITYFYRTMEGSFSYIPRKIVWVMKPDTPLGYVVSQMLALNMEREIREGSLVLAGYGLND